MLTLIYYVDNLECVIKSFILTAKQYIFCIDTCIVGKELKLKHVKSSSIEGPGNDRTYPFLWYKDIHIRRGCYGGTDLFWVVEKDCLSLSHPFCLSCHHMALAEL